LPYVHFGRAFDDHGAKSFDTHVHHSLWSAFDYDGCGDDFSSESFDSDFRHAQCSAFHYCAELDHA
jgi:hypothetical protein